MFLPKQRRSLWIGSIIAVFVLIVSFVITLYFFVIASNPAALLSVPLVQQQLVRHVGKDPGKAPRRSRCREGTPEYNERVRKLPFARVAKKYEEDWSNPATTPRREIVGPLRVTHGRPNPTFSLIPLTPFNFA